MTLPTAYELLPYAENGTKPGPEDIGRVVTIVTKTLTGPNTDNVDSITGRLALYSYSPAEMHTTQALPPELARLTGNEEGNESEHIDPEHMVFSFEGGGRCYIAMSDHEWTYTVHAKK